MTKKEVRIAMKQRNVSLAAEARAEASARIFSAVERLPEFTSARCVGIFCSLSDEPDTTATLVHWAVGRRVVVPRIEGETLSFCDYVPRELHSGAFGIAEPDCDAPVCAPEQIDLIVVPGVAFTSSGARLGRGRGFYDRYLALPGVRAVKVGVCYAHQIVDTLPVEPHDVCLNYVLTDNK